MYVLYTRDDVPARPFGEGVRNPRLTRMGTKFTHRTMTRRARHNAVASRTLDRRERARDRSTRRHGAREMFFDDIGKTLADLLEPAAVGQTKITTSVPKGKGALEGLEIEVDVNKQAHAIAVDLKHALDMPMDGVRVIARGNHHGDLSADVEANGALLEGLDVAVENLARDTSNATIGAKFALDSVGVTANSALSGGSDIDASACFAFDDNTAVGAKATVSPSSGGLGDWTLALQRRDGPTTLVTALTDGGDTITVGVASELDGNTTAGMQAQLQTGGETNSLNYALGISKKLQSGDMIRIVHTNHGDTDVTYTTSLCEGATATGCMRLMSKGHHFKTGFSIAMGQ